METIDIIIDGKEHKDITEAIFIMKNKEGNLAASLTAGLSAMDAIEMLATLSHYVLQMYGKAKPEAKEALYDAYNFAASNVLASFIPDHELRPDITQEALMEMENQIINKKYDKLSNTQKKRGKTVVKKVKEDLAKKTASQERLANARNKKV